jgi:glycosyltransferase involved in cell wall biosynthesis
MAEPILDVDPSALGPTRPASLKGGQPIRGLVRRTLARWHGRLTHNAWISEAAGLALLGAATLLPFSRRRATELLLIAGRRLQSRIGRRLLRSRLRPVLAPDGGEFCRNAHVGWSYYRDEFGGIDHPRLTATILLKAPGPGGEKGVIYSSFEYNWMRLVAHADMRALLDEYFLVGASSWSPPDYAAFANLSGLSPDPVFVGISNAVDRERYQLFQPWIKALPLMASHWINPERYQPKPRQSRSIDILMVANWLEFKRHWILFEALREMDPELRVVLIGRDGNGRTADVIRTEARAFGVPQKLELLTDIPIEQVVDHHCDAKIETIMSGREGSCVAVAEALFADTPVAMIADGHVGSRAFINARTGLLMRRRSVAQALTRALADPAPAFSPRAWAIDNISSQASTRVLNDILRDQSRASGRPWSSDIAPMEWYPSPMLTNPADRIRLMPAAVDLSRRFGFQLAD